MRIGVITLEAGHNYGGILQCYAFMRQLQKYGHDVEFLRIIPAPRNRLTYLRSIIATKGITAFFKKKSGNVAYDENEVEEMDSVFDAFRNQYMKLSPLQTAGTVGEYAASHYDAIFVGSDQTWTDLYNYNNGTFIGWLPEFKGIRMSYACCSAVDHITDFKRKKEIAGFLKKFSYLSVRDDTTRELIRSITGEMVDIVPDPSELSMYEEFTSDKPVVEEKYIMVYVLGEEIPGGHLKAIEKIKRQYGDLKIIGIKTANKNTGVHTIADKMMDNLTPQQWVNLIYHATAVYTDSYHAILFSMKYHKPFVAYYSLSIRASRLIHLREKYRTTNIVSSAKEIRNLEIVKKKPVDTTFFDDIMKRNGIA